MISEISYFVFVFPLEYILGFGLEHIFGVVKSYGLSIIILSLFVNIFLLKIFILTDKKAEFESARKKLFDERIKAWKSVYKKAKLFAFTQTLYRQNHYHPIFALSALGGLAVQIPFFYAMYFVVKNADIKGESFLWISDLSAPDSMFEIHLLPILMTAISLVNVWIVAKEKGARIQGAVIALIFLVLLYQMPSALVLYWTTNMAFSLARAICNSSLARPSREFEKSLFDRPQVLSHSDFPAQPTNLAQDTRIADLKKSSLRESQSDSKQSTNHNNIDCHDFATQNLAMTNEGESRESKNSPSLAERARGWIKLSNFFILRKPLKIAVISLTAILAFLLCATFAFQLSAPHSAKLKFVEVGEAQIDYMINALLRSKSMSASVEIVGVEWDSSVDSSAIEIINNAKRAVNFYSAKPLNLKKGAYLGQVQFKLVLTPLLKNLFRYYFAILGVVFGIYLLVCIILRFQAYNESYAQIYRKITNYTILCIAFLICVFTPYQLYNTDITQFDSTQTYSTLSALFGAFMLCSFIAIYALSFIPKRFSNFVAFILSVILFSGIVYSFILVGDYGAMDRFVFQKELLPFNDPQMQLKQIVIFVIVALAGVMLFAFALKKMFRVWQIAFVTLFVVSGINAFQIIDKLLDLQISSLQSSVSEANTTKQSIESKIDCHNLTSSNLSMTEKDAYCVESSNDKAMQPKAPYEDELFSYSKTHKNIVVIVLDMFSGSHTPYILEQFPYFKEQLDGFVLFPNALSSSNATIYTMPSIISGEYYTIYNMNKRGDNRTKAEANAYKSIGLSFAKAGYEVSYLMYPIENRDEMLGESNIFWLDRLESFREYFLENHSHLVPMLKSSRYYDIVKMLNFGLFKFAPELHFRNKIYNGGQWLGLQNEVDKNVVIRHASTFYATTHIYNANATKPTFKFIYSNMTHEPYGIYYKNDECEYLTTQSILDNQHYDTEVCAIKYLANFIESLKKLGVYNNTQIFIVSDHGEVDSIGIPMYKIKARPIAPDVIFAFKDFGAKGALRVDNRLMANYDISSIFCENLKGGCPNVGKNILKNYPQNREIIHARPDEGFNRHQPNLWLIDKAYKVKGSIYNADDWVDISDSTHGIVNVK